MVKTLGEKARAAKHQSQQGVESKEVLEMDSSPTTPGLKIKNSRPRTADVVPKKKGKVSPDPQRKR